MADGLKITALIKHLRQSESSETSSGLTIQDDSKIRLFLVVDPIRFHQNDVSAYVTVTIYCETSCRIFLKASEI